ncbi:MAG TPA: sugar ABC transporter ATP-binding protein [bacterium]|nr:sugar ABC transporter ATP-binding protein [bacterium]
MVALRGAGFELRAGEIHALLGANGAGKSTLVKIITGVQSADAGEIRLEGRPIQFRRPGDAIAAGIATIYQEFSLVPALTVRENLLLGRESPRRGFIDAAAERALARSVLDRLGVELPLETPVRDLSIGHQQLVEIGRALIREARILILDEPTASLSPHEAGRLAGILRELAARGIGIIFISHRLEEILAFSDRVTVMRDGQTVPSRDTAALDRDTLIEMMVGLSLAEEFPPRDSHPGEIALEVRRLTGARVSDISFAVRRGEVLGLGGLVGAGRSELARLVFGADPMTAGEIIIDGRPARIRNPRDAIAAGLCLLTEDRKSQGLVLSLSALGNFALGNMAAWSRAGWIDRGREGARFSARAGELKLRLSSPAQPARDLSGGNQQKLLVARWLETNARVLIFDEPTRGIDVGAKHEMYLLIRRLAAQGKAIVVISSEFPELLGLCDRILVMRRGQIAGEIVNTETASAETIMALAV